jgi:RNA polymerase sigma factor for flagellar operon FliA
MDWVPRLVRHRAHQLEDVTRELETELGRLPTDDEICARLKMSRVEFERLMRDANAVSLVSLSRKHYDSDSARDVLEIDVLQDQGSVEPFVESHRRDLKDVLIQDLSQAERLIVVLYYYEQMTMKEIGATLDLSESRVSQMHSAILSRLRDVMDSRQKDYASECL